MKVCKYWTEYDSPNGQTYEYCKLMQKKCYCGACVKNCNYKWKNMPIRSFFNRLFNKLTGRRR